MPAVRVPEVLMAVALVVGLVFVAVAVIALIVMAGGADDWTDGPL